MVLFGGLLTVIDSFKGALLVAIRAERGILTWLMMLCTQSHIRPP